MSDLKPCPLCGKPVLFNEELRLFPPEQNMFANKWHGSGRVTIRCESCFLKMDASADDDYESEYLARTDHENHIEIVKIMWNRRKK